ncbi:MAG: NAD(P)/FAD-dependent oxidoreductase [Alphaproteobacteria bacterium]|nr:NAD(P)/FAD-dependent oxidoreductase [Alphaproteobacteria bacterium]MBU0803917.1 NAD(P)/FAD-dependent oxidoreductase [Alphaproteobacteria bacterium]MBU0872786.1 NAD(P)/FAD-dependent oxidoreductase [Alphaproteobacteria bacterium]MBU1402844.1 NAD(P)/FAD-dependent oxidoreductase [Alphaproteobacteria bacterium]MBU1593486.1 NAD(P)/FAD-dependent oxidoreductase [Alphaproteobacteria bacterium]
MTGSSQKCEVLVIGAGPAGLAAAAAAREAGADVICLDLFARPGGQYGMQPASPASRFEAVSQVAEGRAAAARCLELGVKLLTETEVFWAEPGFRVFARQGQEALVIEANQMIVASGAMERPIPFDGWTLPGVMTAGAAQRLIKANGTLPGNSTVLAGSGPFLFAVADTFAKAGLRLRAYVELQGLGSRLLPLFVRHPSRLKEAAGLLRGLRATGASLHRRHVVVEALGGQRLEAVRLAPIGGDGKPQRSRSFTIDGVDSLCIGYGFQPVIDVTSALGAEHRHDTLLGGWRCVADPLTGATSVAGLYAAGETTGIGGAGPARLSGRIAGLGAAAGAGKTARADEIARLARQLADARDFAQGLARLFPFPGHLVDELSPSGTLCRCEDVSRADVEAAIDDGAGDALAVKMWTRAGMGPCQGRICGSSLAELVARRIGVSVAEAGCNRPHMPLRPVPLSIAGAALAQADGGCIR